MQIDAARVAGVNENLANLLLAAKYGVRVCPHAGGVCLCEAVQHLSMIDYVAVSGPARTATWSTSTTCTNTSSTPYRSSTATTAHPAHPARAPR